MFLSADGAVTSVEGRTFVGGGVAGRWKAPDRDRPAGDSDVGQTRHT